MALPNQNVVVVTGDLGADQAVSAKRMTGVSEVHFDFNKQVLTVDQSGLKTAFDVTDQTSLTLTVSSGVYTLTVA